MTSRFERDRGAWVLAHAGHRLGARRRGEQLMRRARRADREGVGAGDAVSHETVTRSVVYRSVFREEGAANTLGWAVFTGLWLLTAVVVIGPAYLISRIAYLVGWSLVPRAGRMTVLPYLALALVVTVLGAVALYVTRPSGMTALLAAYTLAQVILGLAWAAVHVRACGWTAVARRERATGATSVKAVSITPVNGVEKEARTEPVSPIVVTTIPQTPDVNITREKDRA